MIQFVSGNIEQATELMLFNSAEILLILEPYLKNIFQIRSSTSFKYKYANLVFFKYKYKYKYLRIWIQIQIRIRIWTQPWLSGSGVRFVRVRVVRVRVMTIWLDPGDGIDLWRHAIGAHDTGWIGRWDWFMGACDTGWVGAMGLIHGGLPWGHTTLAGSGQWDWFMAVCSTGWNGVMGLIPGGLPWWHATVAWSGRWDWFMGVCLWGEQHGLDRGDCIEGTEMTWLRRNGGPERKGRAGGQRRRCSRKMLAAVRGNHDNGKWGSWDSSRRILMGWCVGTEMRRLCATRTKLLMGQNRRGFMW